MKKFKIALISLIVLTFIVLLTLFLINLEKPKESFNKDYNLAVIETTEQVNKSSLTFYNAKLEKVGTQEIKLGSMGTSFNLPRVYNNNMYVIPQGIGNRKELTVVLEYNMETGESKTYDMKQPAMNSFAVNGKSIYSSNTLNNESIISWCDKSSGNVKTIKEKNIYIGRIDLYDDTLYAFVDRKDDIVSSSYLYLIDTKSFKITDKIDISKSGGGEQYSTKIGDDIYFTNQNEISNTSGQGSYNLTKFNIKNKTITDIKLKENYPFQIIIYKDKLIISHYDLVQIKGNKITIYAPKTGIQQVVTLENELSQIFIKDDKLYSMGREYLNVYSIDNTNFELLSKTDIYTKRKDRRFYYLSGFFTK